MLPPVPTDALPPPVTLIFHDTYSVQLIGQTLRKWRFVYTRANCSSVILHTAHTAWNGHTGPGLCTGPCTAFVGSDRWASKRSVNELRIPHGSSYHLRSILLTATKMSSPRRTGWLRTNPHPPGRPTASPGNDAPPPPASPFRQLLPLNLNQVLDLRHETEIASSPPNRAVPQE